MKRTPALSFGEKEDGVAKVKKIKNASIDEIFGAVEESRVARVAH